MIKERFVRCCQCNEVHNFSEFDDLPVFDFDENKSEYIKKTLNEGKLFLMKHHGHELQELRRFGESYMIGDIFSNPFNPVYYNVTNGIEFFVLKKHRSCIDSPVSYKLISGHFKI